VELTISCAKTSSDDRDAIMMEQPTEYAMRRDRCRKKCKPFGMEKIEGQGLNPKSGGVIISMSFIMH